MTNKTNIVYVVSTLVKSGPTNQLYGIISNLNKNLYNIKVLTLFNEESNTEIVKFISNGIQVDSLSISNKNNLLKTVIRLRSYFNHQEVDIVHSQNIQADFCCTFVPNIIHVSTIRNFAYYDYLSEYGKLKGNLMIPLNNWAINNTDYPICCSKSIMNMYKEKNGKKLPYIQNGVDIKKYKPVSDEEKYELRKKLNLPVDKLIFIVSGSLTSRKDPKFVIDAFKAIKHSNEICLVVIGDGPLYEECKKYENESIIVKGFVSDVLSYLNAADIYISASKSEGLPNSVLEAGACGLDIVLSDIPQHREIFENHSNLAYFFSLNNLNQFKNIIQSFLLNNQTKGHKISEYINTKFSAELNSKKYAELYRKIMFNLNSKDVIV